MLRSSLIFYHQNKNDNGDMTKQHIFIG